MKQGEPESLRAFLKRFNQAALEVPTTSPEVKINALTNSLRDGDLFSSLAKKYVHTFDELLKRAEKYVTLEEVRKEKNAEAKSSAHDKNKESKRNNTGLDLPKLGKTGPRVRYKKYIPLKLEPAEVLEIAIGHPELKFPWSRSKRPTKPKSDLSCHFHNDYGHDTNQCFHLKDEIERLIQAGHLKEFVYRDRQGPRGHKKKRA
ncbi:hypothetical protein ACS0TY_021111 [Phlomoides rotata]